MSSCSRFRPDGRYVCGLLLAVICLSSDLLPGAGTGRSAAGQPRGQDASLRVATFQADATPPLGSPVAYALARKIEDPLSARGIVLLGAGEPIVLCAVDWIGIANGGHDVWREQLARAAGTTADRVAVHALHQHDGPRCDFDSEALLAKQQLAGTRFDAAFARQTIENTAQAIRKAIASARPATHLGVGEARVEKVASNRRILGPDGKVALFRMSSWNISKEILPRLKARADRDGYVLSPYSVEETKAAPEGIIDPMLKLISLWDGDEPIVALTYYATHPQSYFGDGDVTAEFVGLARARRERELEGLPHVHFNGAGGNIAAGKYNDGTPETRRVLTDRMADGMRRAWEATTKTALHADHVDWRVAPVKIPPAEHLDAETLEATLTDPEASVGAKSSAARKLSFLRRMQGSHRIELSCLRLNDVYLLHMPGELFVEYQLAAQKLRPESTVCMAAYGDYGMGYIGTEAAYAEGGYETSPEASNVAPQVEQVLMEGIRKLLQ
jgi:hypothetical protein